ncbi:DUF6855 family protein [Pararhizobium sp. IMCC21322]|uniref:DUF6855 family protein n=1 Tax=Pararhizobium sp. IMCC21322 TaxID=3067903 RepID=UPI003531FA8B
MKCSDRDTHSVGSGFPAHAHQTAPIRFATDEANKDGTVEAWARSQTNPLGSYYGLRWPSTRLKRCNRTKK